MDGGWRFSDSGVTVAGGVPRGTLKGRAGKRKLSGGDSEKRG
jgi:hypothetical protein